MSLLQTRPAFSDVTTIEWLGQNQHVPAFSSSVNNHIHRVQRIGWPKPDLCRNKLVTLLSLPLSKARSNMKRLVYGQTTRICFMRKTLCSGGKVSFSPVLYRLLRNYMQQRMMGDGRWFSSSHKNMPVKGVSSLAGTHSLYWCAKTQLLHSLNQTWQAARQA